MPSLAQAHTFGDDGFNEDEAIDAAHVHPNQDHHAKQQQRQAGEQKDVPCHARVHMRQ